MSVIKNYTNYGFDQSRFRSEAKKSITRELGVTSSLSKLPSISLLNYSADINSTVSINNASRKLNDYIKSGNDSISSLQTANQALSGVMDKLNDLKSALENGDIDSESFKKMSADVFAEISDTFSSSNYNGKKVFEQVIPGTEPDVAAVPPIFMSEIDAANAKNGLDISSEKGKIHSLTMLDHAIKQISNQQQTINNRIETVADSLNEVLSRNEMIFSAGMDHFDMQLINKNYDSAVFQILNNPGDLVKIHEFSSNVTSLL